MAVKKLHLDQLYWDDLRIFLVVARIGNLSQAARQLKLDHSTISRRLARLELSLGGALFERRSQGLKRTPLGDLILPQVEDMDSSTVVLREKFDGHFSEQPTGTVRMALMEGIGSMYIARKLVAFCERYPHLGLELMTSPQLVNVSRREADILLSFFKPTGRGLDSECIGSFALSLYGAQSYFDRYGEPETVEDLANHRFLTYVEDLIQVDAVRWLAEVCPDPVIAFSSNSMLAQMAAASSGLGLVLLPRFSVVKENELRPVLKEKVVVYRELWLSVHMDLRYSARIKAVMNYLKEIVANDAEFLGTSA